jgi:hypothetical protein
MSEHSTGKTGHPDDGSDERRNASGYELNNITWYLRSGAFKRWFVEDR